MLFVALLKEWCLTLWIWRLRSRSRRAEGVIFQKMRKSGEIRRTFPGWPVVSFEQVFEKDVSFEPVRKFPYSCRTPSVGQHIACALQFHLTSGMAGPSKHTFVCPSKHTFTCKHIHILSFSRACGTLCPLKSSPLVLFLSINHYVPGPLLRRK